MSSFPSRRLVVDPPSPAPSGSTSDVRSPGGRWPAGCAVAVGTELADLKRGGLVNMTVFDGFAARAGTDWMRQHRVRAAESPAQSAAESAVPAFRTVPAKGIQI